MDLLKYLEEVNNRKIFLKLGYSTLTKYVMKELGFSESEAHIRTQSLSLMTKSQKAKDLIQSGKLTSPKAATINQVIQNNTSIKKEEKKILTDGGVSVNLKKLSVKSLTSNFKKRESICKNASWIK